MRTELESRFACQTDAGNHRPRVAYIMSRFPKLTETFVLYEMLAVDQQGIQVDLYPLLRARNTASHPEGGSLWRKIVERFRRSNGTDVMHPEAARLVKRAHFQPFFALPFLRAHLHFMLRRPWAYLGTLLALLRCNWGSLNFFVGGLAIFPKVVYFAYRMNADGVAHVHAHFANHPAAAAFIVHRLTGIPYSFTAHGADFQVDQHMLRAKVAEADFVVTISDYNKEFIVSACGEEFREKVVVVRCGVDTEVFRPSVNSCASAASRGPFSIVCTGTMYEVKGHTYLIEACRLLQESGLEFVCHLVGDGPDRSQLAEQVARAGLENRVQFHGRRTREEIAALLRDSDVAVAPSVPTACGRQEGIPVVLMEAMASGRPVVATRISGIPELVEDGRCGILVPPRDAGALAAAVKRLHGDAQLRRRLGRTAREKVLHEFSLFGNAAKLAQRFLGTRADEDGRERDVYETDDFSLAEPVVAEVRG